MEHTPEVIAKLIADLQDEDDFTRSQAAFALGVLGEPAVPSLLPLLNAPTRDMRLRAAWTLGVIGGPAVPALLNMMEQKNRQLRIEAIRILGVIGEARAINHLIKALNDFDPEIAARAARSLGKIGDPRAFDALTAALKHPEADIRYEAATALGMLHLPESVPLLEQAYAIEHEETTWGANVKLTMERAINDAKMPRDRSFAAELAKLTQVLEERAKHDEK